MSAILAHIETVFTSEVIQKINERGEDPLIFDIMSGSVNFGQQLTSSPKFEQLLNQVLSEVDKAIVDFKQGKKSTKSKHSVAREVSPSGDSEVSWDNFVNQSYHTNDVSERRRELALQLGNKNNSASMRFEAADELCKIFAGDVVSNEHWTTVLENVKSGLADEEEDIRLMCIEMHNNFFKVSPPEATPDIHLNLLDHLLESNLYNQTNVDINIIENHRTLLELFKVLIKIMHEMPKNWLCFYGDTPKLIVEKTFTLLSNEVAYGFISYLDTEAEWFSLWMKEFKIRRRAVKALKKCEFIKRAYEGLAVKTVFEKVMKYFLLAHSSSICGQLLQYKDCKPVIDYNFAINKLCDSLLSATNEEQTNCIVDPMHYRRVLSITKLALCSVNREYKDTDFVSILLNAFALPSEINSFSERFILAICEVCNQSVIENWKVDLDILDERLTKVLNFISILLQQDHVSKDIKISCLNIFESLSRREVFYDKIEGLGVIPLIISQKGLFYDKVIHILLGMTRLTRGLDLINRCGMLDECIEELFTRYVWLSLLLTSTVSHNHLLFAICFHK